MRRLCCSLVLFGVWALAACASHPPVAGKCPDPSPLPCLTREICTHDATRGCMSCVCESAENTMPPPKANTEPE